MSHSNFDKKKQTWLESCSLCAGEHNFYFLIGYYGVVSMSVVCLLCVDAGLQFKEIIYTKHCIIS